MSGVKRTEDLHSIKTRSLILQNSDNTFPVLDSVLAMVDSRGHIEPTRDINVNSVAINNDRAIIDGSGNIIAHSITLDSSGTAIQTIGDIFVENGNIYNTGNQSTTGFVQTTAVTLLDSQANNPNTQLYANSGNLFWKNDNLGDNLNISQGIGSLVVDQNYTNLTLVDGIADLETLVFNVNALLTIFSNRQVFLDLSGNSNIPIPPTDNTLSAYNVIFNSPCGMIIRFIDASGQPVPDIGDFVFYGNANSSGATQYTITNLCNILTNVTNIQGSILSDYIQFQYSKDFTPTYQYRVNLNFSLTADTYYVVFLDINRVGEAARLMNHLLFTNVNSVPFANFPCGPDLPSPPKLHLNIPAVWPDDTAQYINKKFGGTFQGRAFTDSLKYPNNDAPLASPTFSFVQLNTSTLRVTVTAPPDLSGLTVPNPNKPGSGNTLQRYGYYVNGYALWLYTLTNQLNEYPIVVTFDVSKPLFNGVGANKLAVTSIDIYNETVRPTVISFP